MVRKDPLLIGADKGNALGAAAANVACVNAANTRAVAASLEALKQHCKSNISRVSYSTALAAIAGAGEHTCDPADPCDPAHRCAPSELPDGVGLAQRAGSPGVRD